MERCTRRGRRCTRIAIRAGGVEPGSLGVSVGIVGGLVAAAMLSATVDQSTCSSRAAARRSIRRADRHRRRRPNPSRPERRDRRRRTAAVDRSRRVRPADAAGRAAVHDRRDRPTDRSSGAVTVAGTGTAPIDPPKPPPPVIDAARDRPAVCPRLPAALSARRTARRARGAGDGAGADRDRRAGQADRAGVGDQRRVLARRPSRRWRNGGSSPATRDGVAVETWRTMTVRFNRRRADGPSRHAHRMATRKLVGWPPRARPSYLRAGDAAMLRPFLEIRVEDPARGRGRSALLRRHGSRIAGCSCSLAVRLTGLTLLALLCTTATSSRNTSARSSTSSNGR